MWPQQMMRRATPARLSAKLVDEWRTNGANSGKATAAALGHGKEKRSSGGRQGDADMFAISVEDAHVPTLRSGCSHFTGGTDGVLVAHDEIVDFFAQSRTCGASV